MGDPVIAADGHSYDRAQIEGWFATGKRTSPMTNGEMEDQVLRPNRQLKSQIGEWRGKSSAQWVADIVAAIVMADDPKEVERKLDDLTGFVAHNKAVVQPTTLQKLNAMLQCSQGLWVAPVQQSLRAVEAECKLVAAGFAARLRDDRRDHGLAEAAVTAAKAKLSALDIEFEALKTRRGAQVQQVATLERVQTSCAAGAERAEKELGGYPEPLGLLEGDGGESTRKRKRAGGEAPAAAGGSEEGGRSAAGSGEPADFGVLFK